MGNRAVTVFKCKGAVCARHDDRVIHVDYSGIEVDAVGHDVHVCDVNRASLRVIQVQMRFNNKQEGHLVVLMPLDQIIHQRVQSRLYARLATITVGESQKASWVTPAQSAYCERFHVNPQGTHISVRSGKLYYLKEVALQPVHAGCANGNAFFIVQQGSRRMMRYVDMVDRAVAATVERDLPLFVHRLCR